MGYQLLASGVLRLSDNASIPPDPNNRDWTAYQAWMAAGNTPQPAPPLSAAAVYAQKIASGLALTSTGTPTLNATYAIDDTTAVSIDGIYAGIRGGDGLPGGGLTFNYPDITGAMHAFDAITFPAFAKAVRDYRYALAQAVTQQNPTWPAATATIP